VGIQRVAATVEVRVRLFGGHHFRASEREFDLDTAAAGSGTLSSAAVVVQH